MSLEIIQQSISTLTAATSTHSPETFKERLYYTYQQLLLTDLKAACDLKDNKDEKNATINALIKILTDNWSLISGTALCYTARPEDDLTLILCDVAKYLSEKTPKAAIHYLMPTICTESMHDDFPNLDKIELRTVLKTHILSQSAHYLIPVRVLSELKGPWEDSPCKLHNYYYDHTVLSDTEAFINPNELWRLSQHSAHTQALIKSKEAYELLLKDAGLLGNLQTLIRALRFNSTSGIGTEETAGTGIYWAISQFHGYYEKLEETIKANIPEPVKAEIDRLLHISSHPEANTTATGNLETCANTRQSELTKLVKSHEQALMAISIDEESKRKLLAQAKELFLSNQATLLEQLDKEDYRDGQDRLGITHPLLQTFNIKPTIASAAELQDFL